MKYTYPVYMAGETVNVNDGRIDYVAIAQYFTRGGDWSSFLLGLREQLRADVAMFDNEILPAYLGPEMRRFMHAQRDGTMRALLAVEKALPAEEIETLAGGLTKGEL